MYGLSSPGDLPPWLSKAMRRETPHYQVHPPPLIPSLPIHSDSQGEARYGDRTEWVNFNLGENEHWLKHAISHPNVDTQYWVSFVETIKKGFKYFLLICAIDHPNHLVAHRGLLVHSFIWEWKAGPIFFCTVETFKNVKHWNILVIKHWDGCHFVVFKFDNFVVFKFDNFVFYRLLTGCQKPVKESKLDYLTSI